MYEWTLADVPRTTNNLEGWHHRLANIISTHPSLYSFLEKLRGEQAATEMRLTRIQHGLPPPTPRRKVMEENTKLKCVVKKYNSTPLMEYLHACAVNVPYE